MLIKFGSPIIDKKEISSVIRVLKSGILVHGRNTLDFEEKFKKYTDSKYSVAVSSCTAGLHLYYFDLGIGINDEVIVPAMTHTATAHAVELVGAKPIFVDCEINTGNIDVEQIEKKITKRTKAISVVHFLGIPAEMNKIFRLSKKYNLKIIEDCALAIGSKIGNTHVGNFGDLGVFSFYPVKHICTGEGGMVITNNNKVFTNLKLKRAFGINKNFLERKTPGFYDAINLGFNYRMSEVEATMGVQQLKKLTKFLKTRKNNFENLKDILKDERSISILDSKDQKHFKSSHYCMTILLKKNIRTKIINELLSKKIGFSVYYPQPVPRMTYYKKKYGYKTKDFVNSERISDNSISLPVGPHLGPNKMQYLGDQMKKILKRYS